MNTVRYSPNGDFFVSGGAEGKVHSCLVEFIIYCTRFIVLYTLFILTYELSLFFSSISSYQAIKECSKYLLLKFEMPGIELFCVVSFLKVPY